MAVVRCESCGGRGVGLVETPHTQCAHCRRTGAALLATPTHGPPPQGTALWMRHHLSQLPRAAPWSTVTGTPCDTRTLPLPTGLDADTCVRLARDHGLDATAVQRATCSCAIDGGVWTWLRGCACPVETWIEYRKSQGACDRGDAI